MTTLARIAIALVMALFMSSCGFDINIGDFGTGIKGNGDIVTEDREITDEFTEVTASEGLHVFVTQANDFEITVEADENVIDLIGTDIKGGRLKIHAIENIGRATKKVYVSLPHVAALKGSSGAHLTTENDIKSEDLEIDGNSGANIKIKLIADKVSIEAGSGANVDVSGKAERAYVDAASGANVRGSDLVTSDCNAEASSGANIRVQVSDQLTANASSGGNIRYTGEANVSKNKSVSGSVSKY